MSENYNYIVKLEIANDKKREDIDLRTIGPEIEAAIADYHALNTVRNKKTLTYAVSEKVLEMHISSPVQLDVPSKALAKFTRLLLKRSEALAATVANKRVFQSIQSGMPASDLDNISACDALKKLVEIFCAETLNDGQIELQRKIKALLFTAEGEDV